MSREFRVPLFVEAKTKKELVKEMIRANLEAMGSNRFFDITWDGKTWSAWYETDADNEIQREIREEQHEKMKGGD